MPSSSYLTSLMEGWLVSAPAADAGAELQGNLGLSNYVSQRASIVEKELFHAESGCRQVVRSYLIAVGNNSYRNGSIRSLVASESALYDDFGAGASNVQAL